MTWTGSFWTRRKYTGSSGEKVYRQFWLQAAEELGLPLKEEVVLRLRSCDASIAREIVDTAAGQAGAYDRIRARRRGLMKEFLSEHTFELKPGVKAFLEKCGDLPVRKVIVTSSTPEEKMPALERLGIGQYFDGFVSVKEVKRGKPWIPANASRSRILRTASGALTTRA